MRKTLVSAAITTAKFSYRDWPKSEGYSVEVKIAIEEGFKNGARLFINQDRTYHHWDFSKCWQYVAEVKLECEESEK